MSVGKQFMKGQKIGFKMHAQIQPYNFPLGTTVKLYMFVLIIWESV